MWTDPYRPPRDNDAPVLPWWMDNSRASVMVALTVITMIFLACIDWNTLLSYDAVDGIARPEK